jgi:diaminopimelate epimerase
MKVRFTKYQALGNDYLVIEPGGLEEPLTSEQVRRICDRHYGAGADGILLGPLETEQADFALRIFNPDGSEAEKSGNGLRILARYLWDSGRVSPAGRSGEGEFSAPFTIHTPGGIVRAQVLDGGERVRVEMGQASFDSRRIPVAGPRRQVINEAMQVGGQEVRYCAVTLGNPHCVVLCEGISEPLARALGPLIEGERRFPRRTNVQFMKALDKRNLQIEIWERGAGYTLSSGSSACAAAAAAQRLGLCESQVGVHMPGGRVEVEIAPDFAITMSGPVEKVFEGEMDLEE